VVISYRGGKGTIRLLDSGVGTRIGGREKGEEAQEGEARIEKKTGVRIG